MAILESVKELASQLGAETNGRDITDQLNKINKHLDEAALSGRDIAEAVKTYSKNASGGGGGGETFEVEMAFTLDDNAEFLKVISYTSTKTHSEVVNAINSGKKVIFTFILSICRSFYINFFIIIFFVVYFNFFIIIIILFLK